MMNNGFSRNTYFPNFNNNYPNLMNNSYNLYYNGMNANNNMHFVNNMYFNNSINMMNQNWNPFYVNILNNFPNYFRFNHLNNNMYLNTVNHNNQFNSNPYIRNYIKIQEILNKAYSNNNENPNNDNNENNNEDEEKEGISDIIKENINQSQAFANNNNMTVDEVDPDFLNSFITDKTLFDGIGHNLIGIWAQGEKRGGYDYIPPNGWIGFGLKVFGKYDNGNNDWLACNGREGEWPIAYHGACIRNTSNEIKEIVKIIIEQNLKPGSGQGYRDSNDVKHPGNKVGVGVYCTPKPSIMEGYAGTLEVKNHKYKVAFMLRVKPDKIRYSNPDIWVLNGGNGDFSEIRPYRFLIKKVS